MTMTHGLALNMETGKRGERRLLRALAAGMALGLLATACEGEAKLSVEEYLARAERALDSGSPRAAVVEAKNALQQQPGNARGRLALARAYIQIGDAQGAVGELQKAKSAGADAMALAPMLGEALLQKGDHAGAKAAVDNPPAEAPAEARAAFLTVRGRALLAEDKLDDAERVLSEALALDAQSVSALVANSAVAMIRQQFPVAQERAARAHAIQPLDPRPMLQAGDIAFMRGAFDESEGWFNKAVALRRSDWAEMVARLGRARARIAAGRAAAAVADLDAIIKAAPSNGNANYLRGLAAYHGGDHATAKERVDVALQAMPNHRPALLLAGAANFAVGNHEQAIRHLQRLIADLPDHMDARKLLAMAQMRVNQPRQAMTTLEGARNTEDADLLGLIGAAAARAGDMTRASQYFQRAVERRPDDALARARLGIARIALGEAEQAVEDLELALKQKPDLREAGVAVFASHLQQRRFAEAMAAARRVQETWPDRAIGFSLAGLAHLAQQQESEAAASFEQGLARQPDDAYAATQLALILSRKGDPGRARELLTQVLKRHPKDYGTLMRLAVIAAQTGASDEARDRLKQAADADPGALAPKVYLARFYMTNGKPQEALAVAEPALIRNPKEPGLLETAGRCYLALRRGPQAVAAFRELVGVKPDSPQARYWLARAHATNDDFAGQKAALESALALAPEFPLAKLDLALLLAAEGQGDRAATLAGEVAAAFPDDPLALGARGDVAAIRGKTDAAIADYDRAFSIAPTSELARKLARARWKKGDTGGALATLHAWLERQPKDLRARLQLAAAYLDMKKLEEARRHYAEAVNQAPDEAVARNDLAWVLYRMGQYPAARTHAQRAYELDDRNPLVLDTLGMVALAQGEVSRAVNLLRTARDTLPDNPQLAFHLASALTRAGEKAQARVLLKSLLDSGAAFDERDEARALLRRLDG
jgi:putative PEP-CTERM system TPR-repeat lipoprotein